MRPGSQALVWLTALWAVGTAHADDAGRAPGPFFPVPLIDADPNSGLTLGLIPTWLHTDADDQIQKIVAPDFNYNADFGFGAHARVISYPSEDTQWSIVAGGQERVERLADYEYQTGRLRDSRWSFDSSAVYDRDGSPRFYGIGDQSRLSRETGYTEQQSFLRGTLGLNISHAWQLAYTLRIRDIDILPGSVQGIPTIGSRFGGIPGLGSQSEILHRVEVHYDTRDDPTMPRHGSAWSVYGGVATAAGTPNAALYSAVGFDIRQLWSPPDSSATFVGHIAARYMPGPREVPFWSLSAIGGDQSVLGESLPLRAYGSGRFTDRNAFATNLEYRQQVIALDAVSTHIEIELTPFIDLGEVSLHSRSSPFHDMHRVAGLGLRGVARPSVVGYLDIGYGSEGAAAFTGINYPF
jgi:outer membrane protein assembly factor BamA